MKVEIKKKVVKEIEEVTTMELKKYWVVRIVLKDKKGVYSVIKEKRCVYEPDEQTIADALVPYIDYKGGDIFASVVCNYRLDEYIELPF